MTPKKKKFIPISQPSIPDDTLEYVKKSIDAGWLSSSGPFIHKFEENFAKFIGSKYAVATNSGTSAIHLALSSLGIKKGDEVIIPAFTMIATVLPILYTGATPVLVDAEPQTGNMNVSQVKKKITNRTKAIIPVHIYGHPVDMEPLIDLAHTHSLAIIEDAAEAHGAQYKLKNTWKMVGGLGTIGCFSFYGNKIITTGEGGMAVTNNKQVAEKIKNLRNLARFPGQYFLHEEIGFAYRMSSLEAAVGISQLKHIRQFIRRKIQIASLYKKLLSDIPYLTLCGQAPYARSVYWQYYLLVKPGSPTTKQDLKSFLERHGIETRDFFVPVHMQPPLQKRGFFKGETYPVAEDLSNRGLCIPSGVAISDEDIKYVNQVIHRAFQ